MEHAVLTPPYDWASILARQTVGNLSLLALVDSRHARAYEEARQAIFPALIHLGMPYAIHDLAQGPVSQEEVRSYRAVLLAQAEISQALSAEGQTALLAALAEGTGLVSFDPALVTAPQLAQGLGFSGGSEFFCSALHTPGNDHFITYTREVERDLPLIKPVPLLPASVEKALVLLTAQNGAPAVLAGWHGAGRWVHYCLSPQAWLNDYLGHANGLDDVFWRSVVWAARKPFLMKAMPPFVTMRIDDAQGVGGLWWNVQQCLLRQPLHIPVPIQRMLCDIEPGKSSVACGFQYIDVLNKHGVIPAVGLFVDQVSARDRAILKRYYNAGKAEFSLHAFSEYVSYEPNPKGIAEGELHRATEFLYHKSWHQEQDGAWVVDERTPEDLAQAFQRADRFWAEAGIRPSRVVNTHYVNPGVNSLPFLKARGQDLMMFAALFGQMYDSHYKAAWSRAPYGSIGMVFDYMPVPEGVSGVGFGDFFNAEAHYYYAHQLAQTGHIDDGNIDFTVGATMKGCTRDDNDLDAAAENIVRQVRMGLDAMFFGCMMAHEQGLAVLTVPEMDEILSLADSALSRYDRLTASYEHIAEYAKCHVDTRLVSANLADGGIALRLLGASTLPLKLYLWRDDGEGCAYGFRELPAFAGGLSVVVR